MERAVGRRRRGHRWLPNRGLDGRLRLERLGGQHSLHLHQLLPHRPDGGKHAPLPSLGQQLSRHGHGVERRQCHHWHCTRIGPCRGDAHGGRQRSGSGSALHPERHGAQPGQWSISVHHAALLPLHRLDNHDWRYGGRHGLGERSEPFRQQRRDDQPDCPVDTRRPLLRRVRGFGIRRVRYDQQLLHCGDRNGWSRPSAGPRGGHAHG